jgi:hypothetical protein
MKQGGTMYTFGFNGGIDKNTSAGITEKFLSFGVVGGKELFLSEHVRAGTTVAQHSRDAEKVMFEYLRTEDRDRAFSRISFYTTTVQVWKTFLQYRKFGSRTFNYSVFLELSTQPDAPVILVRSASELTDAPTNKFYFVCRGRIIPREEAAGLLEGESALFAKRIPVLPTPVANRIIHVDNSIQFKNVRKIKIRRQ